MSLSYSKIAGDLIDVPQYQIAKNSRDGKIYYVEDSLNFRHGKEIEDLEEVITELVDDAVDELRIFGLDTRQKIDIENDLLANEPSVGRKQKRVYNKCAEAFAIMESKFYRAPEGSINSVIPRAIRNQIDSCYVSGPSGAGKTWWSRVYAENYLEEFPGNRVFIFSRKTFDPSLDPYLPGLIRIPLDTNFVKSFTQSSGEPLEDYRNSLIIFDDFTKIPDKLILQTIQHFKNSCFELGRQYNISTISIQHKSLGGSSSVIELAESSHIVCFVNKAPGATVQVLKRYCNFSDKQINQIMDEETKLTRWICIIRPNIIISEKYIKIIN